MGLNNVLWVCVVVWCSGDVYDTSVWCDMLGLNSLQKVTSFPPELHQQSALVARLVLSVMYLVKYSGSHSWICKLRGHVRGIIVSIRFYLLFPSCTIINGTLGERQFLRALNVSFKEKHETAFASWIGYTFMLVTLYEQGCLANPFLKSNNKITDAENGGYNWFACWLALLNVYIRVGLPTDTFDKGLTHKWRFYDGFSLYGSNKRGQCREKTSSFL